MMDPQSVTAEVPVAATAQSPGSATELDNLLRELNFPAWVVDSPFDVTVKLVHEWINLVKKKVGPSTEPWHSYTYSDRPFLEVSIRSCVAKDRLIEFANLPIVFKGDNPVTEGGYIRVLGAEVRREQNVIKTALVFEIRNAYGEWVGVDPRILTPEPPVISVPHMPLLLGVLAEFQSHHDEFRLIRATRAAQFEQKLYLELDKGRFGSVINIDKP